MALSGNVDAIRVGGLDYGVEPNATGNLKSFTSGDSTTATAQAWTDVEVVNSDDSSGDTVGTIFSKITTMMKNARFLYNKIGTESIGSVGESVTNAINALQENKAESSHSHTVADLPVSSTQINSSDYIPTSSLIYSMNTTLTALNDASTEYGTTELTPGTSALTTGKIYCVYE